MREFLGLNALLDTASMQRLQEILLNFLLQSLVFARLEDISTRAEDSWPAYNYGVPRTSIFKRQTTALYVTTGVHTGQGPNGSFPLRLEIRELEKDPISWTLYILGLDMLQYKNQTEMLSWYQLSGLFLDCSDIDSF